MNRQLEILVFGVLFVIGVLFVTKNLMGGVGLVSGVQLLLLLLPLGASLLLAYRPLWLAVMVGLLPFNMTLPLPFFNRFPAGMLIGLSFFAFMVAFTAISKGTRQKVPGVSYKLMTIASLLVLLRLLVDRPGSARLGETGGLGEALLYTAAFIGYWTAAQLTMKEKNLSGAFKKVALISMGLAGFHLLRLLPHGTGALFQIFHRPVWLFAAVAATIVFSMEYFRRRPPAYLLIHLGVLGGIMGTAVLSEHRSRPLFALGIILTVAWVFRRFRRTFIILSAMAVLGLGLMYAVFPSGIPNRIKRSLSTVVPVTSSEYLPIAQQYGTSDEVGWQSEFRSIMWNLAAKRIKKNPVFGNGFSFSLREIMDEFYALNMDPRFRGVGALALAGGYHNSLLTLAVFCGLPVALLFAASMLRTLYLFLIYARYRAEGEDKRLAATLLGFFFASAGQMLMNGGGYDLYVCAVLLAVMVGTLVKHSGAPAPAPADQVSPAPTMVRRPTLSPV